MKKFVIQIVGILSVILLLLLVFDFTYTTIYKNANPRTKFQYLRSLKNTKVNYVFLGSSRVENGIVPMLIEDKTKKSALNLGFQYAHLGDIYYLLQILKQYNIKSDSIFIQVDYMYNKNKGFSNNLPYEMTPFIRDNLITKEYLLNYVGKNFGDYYIPYVRYFTNETKIGCREVFTSLIGKRTSVLQNKGYSSLQGVEQGSNHRSLPAFIASNNQYYEKIKRYAVANKIKIIFFCAPFCKHTKNLGYIKKLKTRIPDLYDFSNAIQDDSLFVNCFHLNEIGAHKFSEILVEEIINNKNKI
ncbi:hypothetical protein [Flavobacterium sp. 83]|uniref:hypothetical protein n=1 Tax=Flavobacterium sp. 83 TaxID=1131812 RepID=UPI00055673AA|nr:hypothetical protein [Flavobacterium sp. 83]